MKLLNEHINSPGYTYDEQFLVCDGGFAVLNEMDLHETTIAGGIKTIKFRGKFQEAEAINKNKRMYPFSVLDKNVATLKETIGSGGLIGELDHPTDSIIHFVNASHKVVKLWWENNVLMGEGIVLNTPMGKLLQSLINDGVRVGISSRGVGNGKVNEEGILVIGESYKLITFDAVADPSTNAAFQEKVVTTRKENTLPQGNLINNSVKNEDSSIHNINGNILLACLGGIIKQTTEEIKRGLK
jgi:hypothetical protein